ncbi:MAG: DMT family transporter [Chloroflexota bacterium]|nr:DMT family transporter [Chloroflexota bacterium]
MTGRPAQGSAGLVGAGLIVTAAVCFGTLGPVTRYADDAGVASLAIVAWRAGLGATAMILLLLVLRGGAGRRTLALRDIPSADRRFIAAASAANLVLNLAMFIAFVRIEIGLALLVFYLYPAVVAVASILWFGERLDALRWAALGLSMFGLVLTLAGSGSLGDLDGLGIGLSLLAAMTQAFYVLSARHGFARIPPIESAAMTMGGAAAGYVVIALAIGQLGDLGAPLDSSEALLPVLMAGLLGAAIPTLCFITGIRLLGAPRAAILATLEPVVGVGLAAWLLNEQPAGLQLVGGTLILVAAVLLQLGGRTASEHEAVA